MEKKCASSKIAICAIGLMAALLAVLLCVSAIPEKSFASTASSADTSSKGTEIVLQKAKKKSLKKATVRLPKKYYRYTGKAQKPKPVVRLNGKKLKRNVDYVLSYKSNKKVGTAKVIVKGKKAFSGKITKTFKIAYEIKYNLNCGTNSRSNPSFYTNSVKLKNPSRSGYVFKGWYSDKKKTKKVTNVEKRNITLYAKWHKPRPWDGVQVVIPATLGESDYPNNRIRIDSYSFRDDGYNYYYMDVKFTVVKIGAPGRSNWGEYVYCFDAKGNLLDKSFLYAGYLSVGETYWDDLMIPRGTKKIVFYEYPDPNQPSSGTGSGGNTGANPGGNTGTGSGGNTGTNPGESEEDTNKWSKSDAEKLDNYCTSANQYTLTAQSNINKGWGNKMQGGVYLRLAVNSLKSALDYLTYAENLANKKATLTTTSGKTLVQLIQDAKATLSDLDKYANMPATDASAYESSLSKQATDANVATLGLVKLTKDLVAQF